MSEPIRAVYDCMILLQAAGRPERVHGTMRAVEEGRVKFVSVLTPLVNYVMC